MLGPRQQAYVSRTVWDISLRNMVGIPHNEDKGEQDKLKLQWEDDEGKAGKGLNQPEEAAEETKQSRSPKNRSKQWWSPRSGKRKIYRLISGTESKIKL